LGRLEIHLSDCDLSKVVREAVSQFSAEASKRGCKLQLEAEVPVNCHCDPIRISQVTANLISNAIKYAPGKPIEVSVRRENQNAVIEVRDHGPGIAPKDHRRIFDRFERGNNKSETQGLGLGLYIAKQIIEAHQGRIEVQSELGQGATFKIIQPQRPP
jgi:signal transduction histidine kinase